MFSIYDTKELKMPDGSLIDYELIKKYRTQSKKIKNDRKQTYLLSNRKEECLIKLKKEHRLQQM